MQKKKIRKSGSGASSEITQFLRGERRSLPPRMAKELVKLNKVTKKKSAKQIRKRRKRSVYYRGFKIRVVVDKFTPRIRKSYRRSTNAHIEAICEAYTGTDYKEEVQHDWTIKLPPSLKIENLRLWIINRHNDEVKGWYPDHAIIKFIRFTTFRRTHLKRIGRDGKPIKRDGYVNFKGKFDFNVRHAVK